MRRFVLLLLLLPLAHGADQAAPPAQRQLDPSKPADALQIVDVLTRHATWPGQDREQVVALERALATLAQVVAPQPTPAELKAKP